LTFFILFSGFHLSESAFQTGWFIESLTTQTLVIHIIRTNRLPFLQSRASNFLMISTLSATLIGWVIPLTPLSQLFRFSPLSWRVMLAIAGLVIAYLILVEIIKKIFYKKHNF